MSDKLDTERWKFILRSLAYIEQGWLSGVEIRYFTNDQEIELNIRSWKIRQPRDPAADDPEAAEREALSGDFYP